MSGGSEAQAGAGGRGGHDGGSVQPAVSDRGFGFMTLNSATAIHRSKGDIADIAFVATSYLSLVLLFWCLRQYERVPANSPAKSRYKACVWLLSTLLTAVFSWRVSGMMPWPVAVVVWLMAASTVLGGFWALFLWPAV